MWVFKNWQKQLWQVAMGLTLSICLGVLLAPTSFAAESFAAKLALSADSYGEEWLDASPTDKLQYCRYAFTAFRSAPSTSYIISSNVQDISPEGVCTRLDQFYSFDINQEFSLSEAAGLAPLLFADVSMDFKLEK